MKWHITLLFQIKFFLFCAYFWLKLSMKFHSKDTSLRSMTHKTSIPNLDSTILCLFLAEIGMKFHLEVTSLRNMTHNTSIPNQIFSICCLFLAEISMKFHSKDTSLRSMTHKTSIPNLDSTIFCLFLAEIGMKFHLEETSLRIWHITILFQIKSFRFSAYFWLKLVWNFIEMIPPWGIWCVTLQFEIIISWIFAYC